MTAIAPAGAWDCHTHVFGAADRFPPRAPSAYDLPIAPLEVHAAALATIGVKHAVVVQPAPYAQDISAMLDALEGSHGRYRGVASARADIGEAAMASMAQAGVCGLRFVEARTPAGERYAGAVEIEQLLALAGRMKAIGWHAEVWSALDDFLEAWARVEKLGVPVVLDHMGGFDLSRGVADPAFRRLVGMVRDGAVGVKLTLCRRAPFGADFNILRPFHDALVEANPAQLLWGSDWPFVRMGEYAPALPDLLGFFQLWVDDASIRQRILVDNPAALYGRACETSS